VSAPSYLLTGVVSNRKETGRKEDINICVGLDVHKDTIAVAVAVAVAVAEAGRQPGRIIGRVPIT
jgi:hypothetical protein